MTNRTLNVISGRGRQLRMGDTSTLHTARGTGSLRVEQNGALAAEVADLAQVLSAEHSAPDVPDGEWEHVLANDMLVKARPGN